MKRMYMVAALLVMAVAAIAQNDPVLMRINGQPVLRSEFEYSYNKNNTEGVIDKKTVDEYVELFVNYKLKVAAAMEAKMDTMTSFKAEFAQYRDQQIKPSLVTDADVENEARKVYENTKNNIGERGLVRPAHILLQLKQQDPEADKNRAKTTIDSIYSLLKGGADFAELAKQFSQDPGSARNGGLLPWIGPNQTFPDFEKVAYSLQEGEMSAPFLSPAGYHIILMKGRKQLEPYDSLRTNILQFLERRNVRESIANGKVAEMIKAAEGKFTSEQIMQQKADSMQAVDPEFRNLIREYHDGLLMYEISNRMVWDKAAKDNAALEAFFKKNKKKYAWAEPRFKGMVYHVKNDEDAQAVKKCVKKLAFDKWAEALRTTFNSDSIIRVRVEKGIFKKGDNALVDREIFKADTTVTETKGYPIDGVYGKVLKKGPETYTDVKGLVIADYQDELEKQWVADLRNRYAVEVDKEVLKTVNKHN